MIGVVADDTTGANDIGIMFAKHGYATQIATWQDGAALVDSSVDVIVIDTDSRLDAPALARQKVWGATRRLVDLGCTPLHKKTCSVFRGNIGVEFDAMLDAAGGQFAVVSLAFPKNGRQTQHGIHTVHGQRLEDTAFAHDPVHPTHQSDLVKILSAQTRRPVGLVDLATVRRGADTLRAALLAQRANGGYCIVDATEQSDLTVLAEAAHDFPILAGSSALAEELPKFWPRRTPRDPLASRDFSAQRTVLTIAGSLTPQTKAQTAALIAAGVPAVTLDSRLIFTPAGRTRELERVIATARAELDAGRDTLVLADQSASTVAATQALGAEHGLDQLAGSKSVSAALADITHSLLESTGLKRLVIAGGDTSGTICRRLGIRGNYVLQEIIPGVPSGLAFGRELLIVLKSGSFGPPDFLLQAARHLKALGAKVP